MRRILRVDVCDYTNTVLCNLYDNHCQVSGEAVNVHTTIERNGWKELFFTIPSTCITEDGEEENFRINFLKADYKLRTIDDKETDYYYISEPKITYDSEAKTVDVRAGHVSQILKNKALNKEFSDDEGNNVGTAAQILDEILEGTGWERGDVFPFAEKDGTEKIRSFEAGSKVGAFSMISSLCELFDAVPIYHGDSHKVDLIPLNPFAKVIDGEIPEEVILNNRKVYELHYKTNIHALSKTLNTENMITRLYVQGAYGDNVTKYCGVDTCLHDEYYFTILSLQEEYGFCDKDGNNYYFKGDVAVGDSIVYSTLDFTSRLYVWNETRQYAYKVYTTPEKPHTYDQDGRVINAGLEIVEPEEVENFFGFLTDFSYYEEVGLFTNEMLQEIAAYQRNMPSYYETSRTASISLSKSEAELSKLAESNTGFCKLDIRDCEIVYDPTLQERFTKIYLRATYDHPDGVIYRTDYDAAEKDYFSFCVAKKLKANGDSMDNHGSMVYILHTDGTWDYVYVKCIYDSVNQIYLDSDGVPRDYSYAVEEDYPSAFGLWTSSIRVNPNDKVYLFCSNSMSGRIGAALTQVESVVEEIDNLTTSETVKHPVYFEEYNGSTPDHTTQDILESYGWCYQYFKTDTEGLLYFCWGARGDTAWHRVYIGNQQPSVPNDSYFFNTKQKVLYRRISGEWYKYETSNEQELTRIFSSVIRLCRRRDMLYRGYYERYSYMATQLPVGNYAFESEFSFYWLFTTDMEVNGRMYLDTAESHVYQTSNVDSIVSASVYPYDTINYPVENELADKTFTQGIININTGVEEDNADYRRSSSISLFEGETYQYKLPAGCRIFYYDGANQYIGYDNVSGEGYFTPKSTPGSEKTMRYAKYARLMIPASASSISQRIAQTQAAIVADVNLLRDAEEGSAEYRRLQQEIASLYATLTELMELANSESFDLGDDVWIRVKDYNVKLYANDKIYKILPATAEGIRKGLNYYVPEFGRLSDLTYQTYLPQLINAQKNITDKDNELTDSLGDLLREGWWQDTSYVEGDEYRLYDDAMDNLNEISHPEIDYAFTFLDLKETEKMIDDESVEWPDIFITDAIHLIGPDDEVNCWGYVDKIDKCFDKPWETTIEINTRLSTINQHDFTDVITRIANVAKQTKARQPIYNRAAALSSRGTITATSLEGAIDLRRNALLAGSSNWYTDDKNNVIFESSDGLTAMLLGGRGIGLANSKTADGDWEWRAFLDGNGAVASELISGYLNSELIEAHSITTDKLMSNVGQELNISSNKALALFATADGFRPAGALKTTDSIIEINAGRIEGSGQSVAFIPASINILTGGDLNLRGGNIHMTAKGELIVESSAAFYLRAGKDSYTSTAEGMYIGRDGLNVNNIFKATWSGSSGSVFINAENTTIGKGGQELPMSSAFAATYTCSTSDILLKVYSIGDTWMCDNTAKIGNRQYYPGYLYICTSISSPRSLNDWMYVKTGELYGTALSIDTNLGTVNLTAKNTITIGATSDITISSGKTLNLLTGGTMLLGNSTKPFTVGADTSNSYIYNGKTSSTDTSNSGVYLGTDGFIVGQGGGNYVQAKADGTVNVTGTINTSAGNIGNFHIGSALYSGSKSSIDANVEGVYIGSEGIGFGSNAEGTSRSKVKITSGGTLYATGASIDGTINSKEGKIADFTIKPSSSGVYAAIYSGSKSTIDANVDGVYVGTDGISLGHADNKSKFKVTSGGDLYAGGDADIKGTIRATSLYIGSNNVISDNKLYLTADNAVISAGALPSDGFYKVVSSIEITSDGVNITGDQYVRIYQADNNYIKMSREGLDVQGGKHINLDVNTTNYVHIDSSGIDAKGGIIKMSSADGSNYVNIDALGIDIKGSRVRMWSDSFNKWNDVWARDDIRVLKSTEIEATVIREMEQAGMHDWVLIRPVYNAQVRISSAQGTYRANPFTSPVSIADFSPVKIDTKENMLGNSASWYRYQVTLAARTDSGYTDMSRMYIYIAPSGSADAVGLSADSDGSPLNPQNPVTFTCDTYFRPGDPGYHNICNGSGLSVAFRSSTSAGVTVTSFSCTITTDSTSSRVTSTVYYFP